MKNEKSMQVIFTSNNPLRDLVEAVTGLLNLSDDVTTSSKNEVEEEVVVVKENIKKENASKSIEDNEVIKTVISIITKHTEALAEQQAIESRELRKNIIHEVKGIIEENMKTMQEQFLEEVGRRVASQKDLSDSIKASLDELNNNINSVKENLENEIVKRIDSSCKTSGDINSINSKLVEVVENLNYNFHLLNNVADKSDKNYALLVSAYNNTRNVLSAYIDVSTIPQIGVIPQQSVDNCVDDSEDDAVVIVNENNNGLSEAETERLCEALSQPNSQIVYNSQQSSTPEVLPSEEVKPPVLVLDFNGVEANQKKNELVDEVNQTRDELAFNAMRYHHELAVCDYYSECGNFQMKDVYVSDVYPHVPLSFKDLTEAQAKRVIEYGLKNEVSSNEHTIKYRYDAAVIRLKTVINQNGSR